VCPASVCNAAAVSVLRIVVDEHWASDVIAAAARGATVGTVVSSVHLRSDAPPASISLGSEVRSTVYWPPF